MFKEDSNLKIRVGPLGPWVYNNRNSLFHPLQLILVLHQTQNCAYCAMCILIHRTTVCIREVVYKIFSRWIRNSNRLVDSSFPCGTLFTMWRGASAHTQGIEETGTLWPCSQAKQLFTMWRGKCAHTMDRRDRDIVAMLSGQKAFVCCIATTDICTLWQPSFNTEGLQFSFACHVATLSWT